MWLSPYISNKFDGSVVAPVGFCTALLFVGLICYSVFTLMDKVLDKQLIAAGEMAEEKSPEDEFHISDLGKIFSSKMFWLVALLCVLYYSAIFPFQRYAPNFLEVTLGVDAETASRLFSCFPILAMVLTPFLGAFLDFRGKGASMLMVGAVIMVACHLSFAFLLPAYPSKWLAVLLIVVLGVSFSLVPAALWPSVPKIIDEKILGFGILPHILDSEHRPVPRTAAHRLRARRYRRIPHADDYLLIVRSARIHSECIPQDRGPQKGLRSRRTERKETVTTTHKKTTGFNARSFFYRPLLSGCTSPPKRSVSALRPYSAGNVQCCLLHSCGQRPQQHPQPWAGKHNRPHRRVRSRQVLRRPTR